MRGLVLAAGALALAGCAGGNVFGYGPAVVGGGGGLPATRAETRQDVVTPPGRRDLGLAVRAFTVEADGATVELAGAACRVTGAAFEAVVSTPARVVIPDLGPDAPPLRAECVAGDLRGRAAVAPVFAWAGSGGTPPDRIAWGLGWTYGYAKVGPMRYPNLSVTLVETAG